MAPLEFAEALSARAACRTCGCAIAKGSWRVGVEAWVRGRVCMTWQHPVCFLEGLRVEQCGKKSGNGKCKLTEHPFEKGDVRLSAASKEHKIFLALEPAAQALRPIITHAHSEGASFDPAKIAGMDDLEADALAEVNRVFRDANKKRGRDATGDVPAEDPPMKLPKSSVPDISRRIKVYWPMDDAWYCGTVRGIKDSMDERVDVVYDDGEVEQISLSEERYEWLDDTKPDTSPPCDAIPSADISACGECIKETEPEADESKVALASIELQADAGAQLDLNEYEQQRENNIRRNRERMHALCLPSLAQSLAPAPTPTPAAAAKVKGLATGRKARQVEPVVARRSARVRGEKPDGALAEGVAYEMAGGNVVLNSAEVVVDTAPSRLEGPVPAESLNGERCTDEAFLRMLTSMSAPPKSSSTTAGALQHIALKEADVAKVVKNAVTHVQFHPSSDRLLLAAADKSGHVGLWDVNNDEGIAEDGVLLFKPHLQYVSGLRWAGGPSDGSCQLYSCSYDGSVRRLDPETAQFLEVYGSDADEYSAMDLARDGSMLYIGDNEGACHVVDSRTGSAVSTVQLHLKKLNTVSLEPGEERILATATGDGTVRVWDVRKLAPGIKPLATLPHQKSVQSAAFDPSCSGRLLSTSYEDKLTIWEPTPSGAASEGWLSSGKAAQRAVSIKHNNQTGRWILPFRAVWTPAGDGLLVGSMDRSFEVFSASGSKLSKHSNAELMTAIPARNHVHPLLAAVAGGTGSGRVHLFR